MVDAHTSLVIMVRCIARCDGCGCVVTRVHIMKSEDNGETVAYPRVPPGLLLYFALVCHLLPFYS